MTEDSIPSLPGVDTDYIIPSVFSGPASPDDFQDALNAQEIPADEGPYVPRMRMVSFVQTFTIWRPWNECSRCLHAIEEDITRLPQMEGDITCPHVQTVEYKAVKDKCLRGEGIVERETFSTLKDGTQIILFAWLEEDKEYLKKLKEAEAKKAETSVWPPNPELVFSQPIEEPPK